MNAKRLPREELVARILELIEAERPTPEERYYTQGNSPLGRARHLRLARSGAIPAFKVGRDVYMKCADVHAFIEAHPMQDNSGEPAKPKAPPCNPLQLVKGL